jgi:hypothetical protein
LVVVSCVMTGGRKVTEASTHQQFLSRHFVEPPVTDGARALLPRCRRPQLLQPRGPQGSKFGVATAAGRCCRQRRGKLPLLLLLLLPLTLLDSGIRCRFPPPGAA